MVIVSRPTKEALVTGQTWAGLAEHDKLRFMAGMVQQCAIGQGHILTQPIERKKWYGLQAAGLVHCAEEDDCVIHITDAGAIQFYLLMETYLPVEEKSI